MELGLWGDVADIIAAIGVVFSLLFLAYELRRSNRETELANWRQLLDSFREFKAVTNDVSFSELIEKGNADYQLLTPAERRSYGQYLEQGIHVTGNFSKHSATIPKQLTGLENAISASLTDLVNHPGARQWWEESKPRGRLMPATNVTVDGLLKDSENKAGHRK